MRISGGGHAAPALGEEAAGVVMRAASLAARRGHAQVTPLHVASAVLSASPALLLRSSNPSSSLPLQYCSALGVCLGVALDRLAVVPYPHHCYTHVPAPSNALVAALNVDRVVRAAASFAESLHVADAHAAGSLEQSNRGADYDDRTNNSPTPAFFDDTEVLATPAATLPPWFRRYQDTLLAGSTHVTHAAASLQADAQADHHHRGQWKFTEMTAENLKTLCGTLELRVPRQHRGIIPGISSVVLRCRSGMARNKPSATINSSSSSTWLLFRGTDNGGGKRAVARELARLVFGSYYEFTVLEGNPASSGKFGLRRQRSWDFDGGSGYVGERLFEAIRENPHRVILINGVDWMDCDSETLVKNAAKEGMVKGRNGEVVSLDDAIMVLASTGAAVDLRSSAACSPQVKKRRLIGTRDEEDEGGDLVEMGVRSGRFSFDLNACAEEDGKEEEEDYLADEEAGIVDVVDGVFCFD
ncbi:protein SMAX1-LIKE 3-like [Brachypodium distachyon]|uniref:protein SMAX1-LIKE 3-like n=1 Tax=Brachypodium distachyon TaxID=15368 RepID=UPI000D0D3D58|nr:protein SMAX1-LIKE 3-like [Brachypodium distachyon]|eukprot:XP_024314644.1 protein SMAX1-LIKE 3-like [Brachypodium distachyon]